MGNKPWESKSTTFSSQITEICHQKFKTIGKNGKPLAFQSNLEWTVLAGIVACHLTGNYYILFLCSGLKCLPQSKLSKTGDLIHDSHAETFIINEMKLLLNSESIYLCLNDTNYPPFRLRNNITFHMYISQSPCGDASTTSIALNQSPEDAELYINSYNINIDSQNYDIMKRNQTSECNDKIEVSKMKDGFRRGRVDYGSFGVLRTKPGRVDSEPTLSMSCSDKIAQWNVVGLQSALLSELISPIYLSSITVGDMFYIEDLNRALYERIQGLTNLPNGYFLHRPVIIPSLVKFERSRGYLSERLLNKDLIPSNIATVWIKNSESAEVLVSGRKQGAIKSKTTGLYLSKTSQFIEQEKTFTYKMFKSASKNYQIAKQVLRSQKFHEWIKCPSEIYENFNLDGELIEQRMA
ncbi:5222_t:CDS:2 [Dentiscutata heterogama]|uniref:5222_t:CDS:1 n=1 Tax=Dentiscutata heterogama TaxID=1316150 RepID=A0ACA9MYD4_9GLOM|nr:5222_t:CDS:2 [Dentiscutata heterogama]